MANGTSISRNELFDLLSNTGALFTEADHIRKELCSDEVPIRGILEFSNHCIRSCLYCGLRKENKSIIRYRIQPEKITGLAQKIYSRGVKTVVLQSGDDPGFTRHSLCAVISNIKKQNPSIAVTLSIGERQLDDYRAFRDAGADRYLLKHETANSSLYARLHPGQSLAHRIGIIEQLGRLGYETGSGIIIGLPDQRLSDLVNDVLLLRSLDVNMVGTGPFIPQRDTPLSGYPYGDLWLTLKVIALTRIATRNTNMAATTALATVNSRYGQLLALKLGCNVLMPDFTPEQERKQYAIYDDKIHVDLENALKVIAEAGRVPLFGRGDSPKRVRAEFVKVIAL